MDVPRKLEPKARRVVASGEHLLAATRATTASRSTFPAPDYLTIGLTNHRIILWKRGVLTSRASRMVAEIPLTRLAGITIQTGKRGRSRMSLAFVDAPPLAVDVSRKDNPARLGETFAALRARPAEDAPAPLVVAAVHEPVPVPAPAPVPVAPPPVATTSPPAPVGSPTSSPDASVSPRRPCRSCGYRNYATATSCWQCFAPLSLVDPTQPATAPPSSSARAPRMPASARAAFLESESGWRPPPPVRIRRAWSGGRLLAVAAVVAAAVGVAAGVYLATRNGAHVVMPASIIGIQKIDSPEAQQVVSTLRDQASKRGWKSDAALYGYSQADPNMMVMTISAHVTEDPAILMRDFSAAAARAGSRLRVNLRRTSSTFRSGATVTCAPFYGGTKGAVCMWEDRDVLGFVAERGLSVDPTDLTAVVRSSVES